MGETATTSSFENNAPNANTIFKLNRLIKFPNSPKESSLEIDNKQISDKNIKLIRKCLRNHKNQNLFKFILSLQLSELFLYPEFVLKLFYYLKTIKKQNLNFFIILSKKFWEEEFLNIFEIKYSIMQTVNTSRETVKEAYLVNTNGCILSSEPAYQSLKCKQFIFKQDTVRFRIKYFQNFYEQSLQMNPEAVINLKGKDQYTILNVANSSKKLIKNKAKNKCLAVEETSLKLFHNIVSKECDSNDLSQLFFVSKILE
jgi:hypothetical protein